MQLLEKNRFPPLLSRDYDFGDSEDFDQSDYEDGISLNVGTHYFYPNWNSTIHENFQNTNSFCPYCGRYVQTSQKMICAIQGANGTCLGHKKCVQEKQNASIQLKWEKSIYTLEKGYLQTQKPYCVVGGKQYVLSTTISHPLSNYKYFQMNKKVVLGQSPIFFNMELNSDSVDCFNPNKIVLPLPHMNIKLDLKGIGSQVQQQNINFNVDLSQIFVGLEITEKQSAWVITFSNSNIWTTKIQVQLIFDQLEKKKQIEMMNFKYQHPLISTLPLVKLNKIILLSKNCQSKMMKSGIENTKTSSNFSDMYEEMDEQPMSFSAGFYPIRIIQPKVNQDIRSYSKTQAGSKELQKRFRDMKTQQLTNFIDEITPFLCELLEDDYANYMVQTLISFSNSQQRLKIFKSLNDKIIHLVCLKQGTFAFQQMVSFLETEEQFQFFTKMMAENFFEVATNQNGNHFLRKLIPMMTFAHNEILIKQVYADFVELVNNKSSVCVLKVILKVIDKEVQSQLIKQIKKKIIDLLTMNTEKIIKNQFGNYFIQESFEIFGSFELKGISEFIFSKFRFLAKQKFSSSVICKCISNYWRDTQYYDKLKSRLNTSQILELFKNKEGNKVLLELMTSQADFGFKNKISGAISNYLPSKFNASKWIGSAGSNTVRVGNQNYLSFSDAIKDCQQKISPMAKKRNYNIH